MARRELASGGPDCGDRQQTRSVRGAPGLAGLGVIVALLGCAAAGTRPAAGPTEARAPSGADAPPAAADERSVRPGVNDRYFRPGSHDRWARMFAKEKREVFEHRGAIVEALEIAEGATVADVGAGTGLFTDSLADEVGVGGRVYAIDIVPTFLEDLRVVAAERANVEVIAATPLSSGLSPHSIDLAFLCDVYHHLEYPKTYLSDLRRALRPGGRLVVIDFHRIEGVTSEPMLKHVRADRETVIAELEEVGFVVVGEIGGLQENYGLVLEPR